MTMTVVYQSKNGGGRSSWTVEAASKLEAIEKWEKVFSGLWYELLWIV